MGVDHEGVAILADGGIAADHGITLGKISLRRADSDGIATDGCTAPCAVIHPKSHIILGKQGIGGLDSLQRIRTVEGVSVALARECILVGYHHREGNIIFPGCLDRRVNFGISAVGRNFRIAVPISPLRFHSGSSGSNGGAGAHLIPEGFLVKVVTAETDGLRIAIDHFHALFPERFAHGIRGHAQANGHPKQAIGTAGRHMVGDGGTVDTDAVAVIQRAVIIVFVGQAGGAGQAQIGTFGTGNIVIAVFIVGHTVGVEDDHRALADGLCYLANRSGGAGIEGIAVGIANGIGDGLGFIFILVAKIAVVTIVRPYKINLIAGRPAPLGCGGLIVNAVSHCSGRSFHLSIDFPQPGAVNAADARIGFPGKGVAVANQRTFHIAVGSGDNGHSSIGQGSLGTVFLGRKVFHGLKFCKDSIHLSIVILGQFHFLSR